MKDKKLLFIILFVGVFLFCVGVVVRNSFVDDTDARRIIESEKYNIEYIDDLNHCFVDSEKIDTIENLVEMTDAVVKISTDKEKTRYFHSMMTVSEVTVEEVLCGDVDADTIYILEPIGYYADGDLVISMGEYNWIKDDDTYVMFLRKYKDKHIGRDDNIYLPVDTKYSKYNISEAIGTDEYEELYNIFYEKVIETYGK